METLKMDHIGIGSAVRIGIGLFMGSYVLIFFVGSLFSSVLAWLGIIGEVPWESEAPVMGLLLFCSALIGAIYGAYLTGFAAIAFNISAKISGGLKFDIVRSQESETDGKKFSFGGKSPYQRQNAHYAQVIELLRIDLLSVFMTGAVFLGGVMLVPLVLSSAGGLVQHLREFSTVMLIGGASALLFAAAYNALAGAVGGICLVVGTDVHLDDPSPYHPITLHVRSVPLTKVLVMTANILVLSWCILWFLMIWQLTADPSVECDMGEVARLFLVESPFVSVVGLIILQVMIVVMISLFNYLARQTDGLEFTGEWARAGYGDAASGDVDDSAEYFQPD